MKALLFLIHILVINIFGFSPGDELVSNSEIDSLVNKADAVVLSEEMVFHVSNLDDGELFYKKRILIKNKKAEKYCKVVLWETKFVEIDDIEAVITDTLGTILKELDDDDIEEAEFTPGYVLYADNTRKRFKLTHKTYPYIFEYSYTKEIKSLFFWPSWYPQDDIPVLSSTYKLILEKDIKYKTYSIGLNTTPTKTKINGDPVLVWQALNIPPLKKEGYLPPENKVQNAILFSAVDFELEDSIRIIF